MTVLHQLNRQLLKFVLPFLVGMAGACAGFAYKYYQVTYIVPEIWLTYPLRLVIPNMIIGAMLFPAFWLLFSAFLSWTSSMRLIALLKYDSLSFLPFYSLVWVDSLPTWLPSLIVKGFIIWKLVFFIAVIYRVREDLIAKLQPHKHTFYDILGLALFNSVIWVNIADMQLGRLANGQFSVKAAQLAKYFQYPAWNPEQYCGAWAYIYATPVGYFWYWLLGFFPLSPMVKEQFMKFELFLPYYFMIIASSIGFYLLMRQSFRLSRAVSIFGGMAYTLNFFMLGILPDETFHFFAYLTFPWTFFLIEQGIKRRNLLFACLSGLILNFTVPFFYSNIEIYYIFYFSIALFYLSAFIFRYSESGWFPLKSLVVFGLSHLVFSFFYLPIFEYVTEFKDSIKQEIIDRLQRGFGHYIPLFYPYYIGIIPAFLVFYCILNVRKVLGRHFPAPRFLSRFSVFMFAFLSVIQLGVLTPIPKLLALSEENLFPYIHYWFRFAPGLFFFQYIVSCLGLEFLLKRLGSETGDTNAAISKNTSVIARLDRAIRRKVLDSQVKPENDEQTKLCCHTNDRRSIFNIGQKWFSKIFRSGRIRAFLCYLVFAVYLIAEKSFSFFFKEGPPTKQLFIGYYGGGFRDYEFNTAYLVLGAIALFLLALIKKKLIRNIAFFAAVFLPLLHYMQPVLQLNTSTFKKVPPLIKTIFIPEMPEDNFVFYPSYIERNPRDDTALSYFNRYILKKSVSYAKGNTFVPGIKDLKKNLLLEYDSFLKPYLMDEGFNRFMELGRATQESFSFSYHLHEYANVIFNMGGNIGRPIEWRWFSQFDYYFPFHKMDMSDSLWYMDIDMVSKRLWTLDLLGIKHLIVKEKDLLEYIHSKPGIQGPFFNAFTLEGVSSMPYGYPILQLRNNYALPLMFLVNKFRLINPAESWGKKWVAMENLDYRNSVLLEEMPEWESGEKFAVSIQEDSKVEIKDIRGNIAAAEVSAGWPYRLLFYSDNYHPDWIALIDGMPAKIYRADLAFKSIIVPAGRHLVWMEFRPFSLWMGFYISSITILAISAAACWKMRKSGGVEV